MHRACPGPQPGQAAADVHEARRVARGEHLGPVTTHAATLSASMAVEVSAFFRANVPPKPQHSSARSSSTRSIPCDRAQQAQRLVPDPQDPQRVAGRVVRHPVREVRADVGDPQHVDQELRQFVGLRRHRLGPGGQRRTRTGGRWWRAGGAPNRRRTRTARRWRRTPRRSVNRRTSPTACRAYPVLMCIWPQQVCAGGNATSWPSRSSTVTVARPTSGKSASARQVTKSAIRMSSACHGRPGRRAGCPYRQLRFEDDVAMFVVGRIVGLLEQELSGGAPQLFARLAHRGQRHRGGGGEVDVVIAHDRHVLRHPDPALGHLLQHTKGEADRWRRTPRWGSGPPAQPARISAHARRPAATVRELVVGGHPDLATGHCGRTPSAGPPRRSATWGMVNGLPTKATRWWALGHQVLAGQPTAEHVVHRDRAAVRAGPVPRSTSTVGVPRRIADGSQPRVAAAADRGDQHAEHPLLLEQVEVAHAPGPRSSPLLPTATTDAGVLRTPRPPRPARRR